MKHVILDQDQSDTLMEGLTVDGEVELYMPIVPKPPRYQKVQKIGVFTVTRMDPPPQAAISEYIRIGFKFAQYFKRQLKKVIE